jgi:hypothetical protein
MILVVAAKLGGGIVWNHLPKEVIHDRRLLRRTHICYGSVVQERRRYVEIIVRRIEGLLDWLLIGGRVGLDRWSI